MHVCYLLHAECGPSILTSAEGEITSPGFPGSYPSYTSCTWTVRLADNDIVTLFFRHFNMGHQDSAWGQQCLESGDGAVLSVYDGDSADNGTLVAT